VRNPLARFSMHPNMLRETITAFKAVGKEAAL